MAIKAAAPYLLFETDARLAAREIEVKTLKVGLIGPNNAGKSEFIKYSIKGNRYRSFEIKGTCHVRGLRVHYDEDSSFILDVYEYRGPRSHQLAQITQNACDVYFLMYDVSNDESFKEVKYQWLVHLYEKDVFNFVIGNKSDVDESLKVDTNVPDVSQMAWQSGHLEVSSITGRKIDFLVQRTAEILLDLKVSNKGDQLDTLSVASLAISEDYDGIPSYDMSGHRKGLCIIINNQEFSENADLSPRDGSQHDVINLKELFQELGFLVNIYTNLPAATMKQVLRQAANNLELALHKAFVCVVLSHGTSSSVYGADGQKLRVSNITKAFTAKKCPLLIAKPKLFFIQACRGTQEHESIRYQTDHAMMVSANTASTIPNEADFLVAFSTVDGYMSYRDPTAGSIFISLLVECLHTFRNLNLVDVLTILNEKAAEKDFPGNSKQMTCFRSTLRKRLILM